MDFNIDSFTNRLMELIADNVPYETEESYDKRHKNRNGKRLKDLFSTNSLQKSDQNAFNTTISQNINIRTVDVGGPMAEAIMPQYHILQQAQVIHKRGRATTKSKGSQDKVKPMERDYEKVTWNGKTFTKEYNKNVRGSRKRAEKLLSPKLRYTNGKYQIDDRYNQNVYVNTHYKYIDKILDTITPWLAGEYGLKLSRKQDTGLQEEYNAQQNEELNERFGSIFDILNTHDIGE